jgi:PTS system nitrogen regulatory IIA component
MELTSDSNEHRSDTPAVVANPLSQRVASWLEPDEIALDVEVRNRRHALEWAAQRIGHMHALDAAPIFRALWRRELVGSTALGHGVAIPHARIDGIERPLTLFVRPKYAIDFAAPDDKPVAAILAIMVPASGDTDAHLELLALVAQAFSEASFRSQVCNADEVFDVRRAFREFAHHVARPWSAS